MRTNWSSNTPWEKVFGYSRAVQIGNTLEVSGTTASEGDKIIGLGDITLQTEYIIKKIEHTLVEAGFDLKNVVRTRIFITDITQWQEVAKVHAYLFEEVMPACTLVEVSNLIHPDLLLEIEATAVKEDV
ncbi:RidA family protein [Flavobacteriales bacterium]|jgi:enamine deaminase RidA (YjgF/YER057c/UK114 family)|nr:RidA family protein [Flavobacteriales bacterium]MDG1394964.1 RidA family protein [Flavobacteriales bacterium]|tara:strand:- start:6 stop:392 length:387 start_codon:yes stop_codon:yes gene_type:complete